MLDHLILNQDIRDFFIPDDLPERIFQFSHPFNMKVSLSLSSCRKELEEKGAHARMLRFAQFELMIAINIQIIFTRRTRKPFQQ